MSDIPPAPTVTSIPPPSESLRIIAQGLDPITALLYDLNPGEGRVILECYGEALAGYWHAMGPHNIRSFISMADPDYLAGKMIPPDATKRRIAYLRRVVSAFQTAIRSLP